MPRFPLLAALVLAACAGPPGWSGGGYADAPSEVGGLTADEVRRVQSLGFPVLVPGDVGAFELSAIEASALEESYRLAYRRADGVCFEVSGGTEGFGGPAFPLVSAEVEVADLGRLVRIYQAADDPAATSAQVWGIESVVSDIIEVERTGGRGIVGVLFLSDTQGGCRPVSLDEGAALVSDLRLLVASGARVEPTEPVRPVEPTGPVQPTGPMRPTGPGAYGTFAPADDLLEGINQATSPTLAADAIARRYDGAARNLRVEILSETDREAVALVTALGLPDDSILDERLLLTYRQSVGTWSLADAGRQVRCQPERGHQEWGPGACL